MRSWIWIVGWHVDLCISACILMWSYELVMHFKLETCPKYLICVAADLWLMHELNVGVYFGCNIAIGQLVDVLVFKEGLGSVVERS